jgi:hypothetical protein
MTTDAQRREQEFWSRPCAAAGLRSFRLKGRYDWIMIGATDREDAMREAQRSTPNPDPANLEEWDGTRYVPAPHAMSYVLLSVGDYVEVTNDYGVYCGLKRIVEVSVDKFGPAYYLVPTEATWSPWRTKNLRHVLGRGPTPNATSDRVLHVSFPDAPRRTGTRANLQPVSWVSADEFHAYCAEFHCDTEERPGRTLMRLRYNRVAIAEVATNADSGAQVFSIRRGAHTSFPEDLVRTAASP